MESNDYISCGKLKSALKKAEEQIESEKMTDTTWRYFLKLKLLGEILEAGRQQ